MDQKVVFIGNKLLEKKWLSEHILRLTLLLYAYLTTCFSFSLYSLFLKIAGIDFTLSLAVKTEVMEAALLMTLV